MQPRMVAENQIMDLEHTLLSLLVVLVAARFAAEVAERIHQPGVLVEILVGILIGPSALGLIHSDNFLSLIGELGAILLLFEVGMQMDLRELGRVGVDSLRVAGIGIVVPMVLAMLALSAMGVPQTTALFLAGGITATSVGITARVFGDLRALASVEARTVLGAAVADDVGGLVILTVVVALGSGKALTAGGVASVIAGALGFVILATAAAIWLAPRLFKQIAERSRTEGTLMALGLAFALAIARLASFAKLAPIVGAFIAGLALSRTEVTDDLQRRMVPLIHFFVPVFFLEIGIATKLRAFSDPSALVTIGVLAGIAVAGKIVAGIGVTKGKANRLLVGVAMIPRGEVGLIFAGIGLTSGILDPSNYAVLVAVVLVTTLVTPPGVRHLILRVRRHAIALGSAAVEPAGGWLNVSTTEVELNAEPPDILMGRIGFEAAVVLANRRPGSWLLQWLSSADGQQGEEAWDDSLRQRFFKLLRHGNERSWRFLQVTGLLAAHLPELEAAAVNRKRDPFNLDPAGDLRWGLLEDLHALIEHHPRAQTGRNDPSRARAVWERLAIQDIVLLAALARSAFTNSNEATRRSSTLALSIGLSDEKVQLVEFLVAERQLLLAAARRIDMGTEDSVLELASHIGNGQQADALYVLAVAEDGMETWERERLDELYELVQSVLTHPELMGAGSGNLVDLRRREMTSALSHLPRQDVERHLRGAPSRYLMAHGPEVVQRHLAMTATPLARYEVRLEAERAAEVGQWNVHVAVKDRRGLLASIAGAFASHGVSVQEAFVSTWQNGEAIDVFRVVAPDGVDWGGVRSSIAGELTQTLVDGAEPKGVEGIVDIDNLASPWHTILEVRTKDRTGLLQQVASALAVAGLQIHMAVVRTSGDVAVDVFYVTGRSGGKLDEQGERDLRRALSGSRPRRWRLSRRTRVGAEPGA